jgi:ribonuclease D
MPSRPPDVSPDIVKEDLTAEQLQGYLASGGVAVDTETLGLHVPRDRLCLVQLCDRGGHATLVQITANQLQPSRALESRAPRLKQLLEAPEVLKVFHFARFDVAAVLHYLGIRVAPLYCTRTASKVARTYTDRHGLKDIALELLDVEMDKAARHTDWSNPDLRPDQVRYAISDVTLLLPLMDRLEEILAREGRADLAHECFRAIPTFSRLDLLGYQLLFEH